jgi:uncharacterized protein
MKINSKIKFLINKITFKKEKKNGNKIKLSILGISYNQTNVGAIYVLILGDKEETHKIPVIMTFSDAQSIAMEVEHIKYPVPLVYDFIKDLSKVYKFNIKESIIVDYKDDVLKTVLVCDDKKETKLDIRTPDALALSVRFGFPVYIYENVLEDINKVIKENYNIKRETEETSISSLTIPNRLEDFTTGQLKILLQEAIEHEDYERASVIRDEINKKSPKE